MPRRLPSRKRAGEQEDGGRFPAWTCSVARAAIVSGVQQAGVPAVAAFDRWALAPHSDAVNFSDARVFEAWLEPVDLEAVAR